MTLRAFDHIVLVARDLDAQSRFYEGLGFTLTPRAQHPWGTTNRLIQMQGVFLELLSLGDMAIEPPAPGHFSFGAFTRDYLARREGLAMLVLRTADAAADRALWRNRGLDTYELFDFARSATLPDGRSVKVAFTLCFVTDPAMPDALFFVCQQHYPENFWKPEFQVHANGATGVASVWMAAAQPQRHASFFARLTDEQAVRSDGHGLRIAMQNGELIVADPASLAARFPGSVDTDLADSPRFAGLAVNVDLARTRSIARAAGRSFHDGGEEVRIGPDTAFGAMLVLR